MSESMMTSTVAMEEPKLSVLDLAHFMRSFPNPVKREIAVGSMARFAAWAERDLPLAKVNRLASEPAAFGVPVKEHPYLPPNIAVLTVNGEIEAIINLDDADPAALKE